MSSLPYVTAPGNVTKALNGIRTAATPQRVSQDFVKTVLNIPGGSGDQMTSYLKKIGFAGSDGTPTDLYKKFRNEASSKRAVADAIKVGYAALFKRNEFLHKLNEEGLKGLIVEETGQAADATAVTFTVGCIKALKSFADFEAPASEQGKSVVSSDANEPAGERPFPPTQNFPSSQERLGLNLSYTINLNLPASSDVAVFNAIFKSLKDNLLKD